MSKQLDKQFQNMSLDNLRQLVSQEKEGLKKDFNEFEERRKLIKKYRKLKEFRQKVKQGKVIKKKPKVVSKTPFQKIKTFEDYFEECIKNKKIPKDTPSYLRKALERAIKEYDQGIEIEKSALDGFAKKHLIKGEVGITPFQFFRNKKTLLKDFLRNHRNIKVRFVLVCKMEEKEIDKKLILEVQDKAYFHSDTYINLESTDVKEILIKTINNINEKIIIYQQNGSGWYFKEVIQLEIHTVKFSPMKGSSYIPLPDWIMRKKAIVSIRNKDEKCFLWSILRYLHPREKNDCRLKDLKQYENEIIIPKGITFPVKIKEISKFESLNPNLPGINVFSVSDDNKFYPLRMALRDPQKSIDLFLYEEDGKFHYSLIKNFSRLFRSQITSRTNEPIQICKRCLSHYTKPELLEKHIKYCSSNETTVVKLPEPNTFIYFKNYYKKTSYSFCCLCRF